MKKSFCSIGDGRERWSFTSEKASFAASDWTNGVFYWWKVIVRQTTSSLARKLASRLFIFKMSERFVDVGSVDNFIAEQENKATLQKTQRDVKLLQTFLGTRNELRKVGEIPALEQIHLRVYHLGQNQRWGRLWAFFAPKSSGKFWTSKKEQLLCQYHEWPRIWENKKWPPVQTERVKEERKLRKQAKRFDSSDSGGQIQWVKTLLWYEYVVMDH